MHTVGYSPQSSNINFTHLKYRPAKPCITCYEDAKRVKVKMAVEDKNGRLLRPTYSGETSLFRERRKAINISACRQEIATANYNILL
jgi:hypothetical protein